MTVLETILKAEEGCRLTAYDDSQGYKTIGYGHLVTEDDNLPDVITQTSAEDILADDMEDAVNDTDKELLWVQDLDENRAAIIYSMAFQMGIDKLVCFRATLRAIQEKRWQDAQDAMLNSAWATQTPARAKRHAEVILTGILPEYYT
jgi:lysozyme